MGGLVAPASPPGTGADDPGGSYKLPFPIQRDGSRVDAVAQAGGRGAVREDVAEVAAAGGAGNLDPPHAVAHIFDLGDVLGHPRLPEARPAGARVEFFVRLEQRVPAADADVSSLVLACVVLARKGGLGPAHPRDGVLLSREMFFPLLVGFRNLGGNQIALF